MLLLAIYPSAVYRPEYFLERYGGSSGITTIYSFRTSGCCLRGLLGVLSFPNWTWNKKGSAFFLYHDPSPFPNLGVRSSPRSITYFSLNPILSPTIPSTEQLPLVLISSRREKWLNLAFSVFTGPSSRVSTIPSLA